MNRDELNTRPRSLPPSVRQLKSGLSAMQPTDTASRGTWISANNSGLMLALTNGNPRPMPPLPPPELLRSRGRIIPDLIPHRSARAAIKAMSAMGLSQHAPFRVVAADRVSIISAAWDCASLSIRESCVAPICFVSSGLGDELVGPRLELFNEWIARFGPTDVAQDAFHQHVWPDRPEISVMMRREGARTVSVTTIEPREGGTLVMRYSDDDGSSKAALPPLMLEPRQAR